VKKITLLMTMMVFLISGLTTATAEEKLKTIVNNLQDKYDNIYDFSATFNEVNEAKFLGAPASRNGNVYYKKPGKFKYIYTGSINDDNFNHEIITNGETMWYYKPNEKQVVIYESKEVLENEFFLPFLFGEGKLTSKFEVAIKESTTKEAKDSYLVALRPKEPDTGVEWILLVVDKQTYLIQQINTYFVTKNVTRIAFEEIKTNQNLKDSFFNFQVPSGVELIRKKSNYSGPPKTKVDIEIIEKED